MCVCVSNGVCESGAVDKIQTRGLLASLQRSQRPCCALTEMLNHLECTCTHVYTHTQWAGRLLSKRVKKRKKKNSQK